ncbi:hypothetical protein Q31b_15810 [Novipirellula aureliae]|uniref:Uncharacterized protein n=1 Tax=Novipirellula aureliae TaxID=2527966 RepID=A0A5C6E973_9BACT|nr:SMI1/KNR4 family protein [Novipirellula aureliae]TWU44046.1 hypothetical protein Q31b_15810 [Novipirellula aureliae]
MSAPKRSPHQWSAQIAERYSCVLSDDLADWFDAEIWKGCGSGEYCESVHPETLLSDAPDVIWPGLMPANLLPILGDSMGNWLGVRIDCENKASQIVHWFHGGGDWIPWGNRLSEAIVFETLVDQLPGPRRAAALPAENFERQSSPKNDAIVRWAFAKYPSEIADLLDQSVTPAAVADRLLRHSIAEVAVRFELIQAALFQDWSSHVSELVAESLELDWNQVVNWIFDADQMPESAWQQIEGKLNHRKLDDDCRDQDWDTAAMHARACQSLAPDLSWPWDLIGYYNERLGKRSQAVAAYGQGAMQSTFTDQSVRLHMHFTQSTAAKFSIARLHEIDRTVIANNDYFQLLQESRSAEEPLPLRKVCEYWMRVADDYQHHGNLKATLDSLMRAGWDLGAEQIADYGPILEKIEAVAADAGQVGRSRLAAAHRQCLNRRYGV